MKISVPFEIGDLVYAIDCMESKETKRIFYALTSGVISSIALYTTKKGTEHTVLLETTEGVEWGIDIPLDWISKDKEVLIKKIVNLL